MPRPSSELVRVIVVAAIAALVLILLGLALDVPFWKLWIAEMVGVTVGLVLWGNDR